MLFPVIFVEMLDAHIDAYIVSASIKSKAMISIYARNVIHLRRILQYCHRRILHHKWSSPSTQCQQRQNKSNGNDTLKFNCGPEYDYLFFIDKNVTRTCCIDLLFIPFSLEIGLAWRCMYVVALVLCVCTFFIRFLCWYREGNESCLLFVFAFVLFVLCVDFVCTRYHFEIECDMMASTYLHIFIFARVGLIYKSQSAMSAFKINQTKFLLLEKYEPKTKSFAAINFPCNFYVSISEYGNVERNRIDSIPLYSKIQGNRINIRELSWFFFHPANE